MLDHRRGGNRRDIDRVLRAGRVDTVPRRGARRGGVGEAAFFVGAATMITDLAPESTTRRADQLLVGRGVQRPRIRPRARRAGARNHRTTTTSGSSPRRWRSSRRCSGGSRTMTLASTPPPDRGASRCSTGPRSRRASCSSSASCGLAGFTELVPLYVKDSGSTTRSPIFLLYGVRHPRGAHRGREAAGPAGRRGGPRRSHSSSAASVSRSWRRGRTITGLVVSDDPVRGRDVAAVPGVLRCRSPESPTRERALGGRHGQHVLRPLPGARCADARRRGRGRRATGRVPRRDAARVRRARGAAHGPPTCGSGRRHVDDDRRRNRASASEERLIDLASAARAVVARHQRLPAEVRWHPVVSLRALATAAAGGDDGAHDARTAARSSGMPRSRFVSNAYARRC